ncbi:MAG TPA: FAD-binding oxidoreductase [Acidimicrobiia bacterium]
MAATTATDVLVVGGGIAGVSAAYALAYQRRVTLIEREPTLSYHTTGRSAAQFSENYGARSIRALARSSRLFFQSPPAGLVDVELLSPRGGLWIGRPDQMEALAAIAAEGRLHGVRTIEMSPAEAVRLAPMLRIEYLGGAVSEPDDADLDVAALHQGYVRGVRAAGGEIVTTAGLERLERRGGSWVASIAGREIRASVVVNAAGAWCDQVASLAGVEPIGLIPYRRTVFMVPGKPEYRERPMVMDVDEDFYFKPDGDQLLCSPADETPSEPTDARPDEADIAAAIERINQATTLDLRTVRSSWAGLRSFSPDRSMVIGFEPSSEGFFWLAGQGGIGIMSSPAAARLAAGLILDGHAPADLLDLGLSPETLSPGRFRIAGAG